MQAKDHWEKIYSTKAANAASWFQPHADSLLGSSRPCVVVLSAAVAAGLALGLIQPVQLNRGAASIASPRLPEL